MELELAKRIIAVLRAAGYQAYLVGGCVRDLLLGLPPKDFDISASARPEQVLALFPHANLAGAHFGVVIVRQDGAHVEVATFRRDAAYEDGRRPTSVYFESTPAHDVQRRDFTINALMLDPETGEILDLVEGKADLQMGIVRAIGSPTLRFEEDHLRLLRAVRFAARLRFEIEPGTMTAMRALSRSIRDVSLERVRDELSRILTEGGARRGFELLDQSGLLPHILPEIAAMKGVEQPPEFHPEGDVWTHTLIMLEGLASPSLTLALGVLLHDVGKPPTFRIADRIRFDGHVEAGVLLTREILNRLRYSSDVIEQVVLLVANHMRFSDAPRMRESTLKRFLRLPAFDEHLALHRLDCLSSHGHLDNHEFMRRKQDDTPPEHIKPPRLLTGRGLIAAGFVPGPAFSRVLNAVEDAQLEHRVSTPEEALHLAKALFHGIMNAE
jgi:tRNA nucleotidyltransferase/poly(A) polymerase